MSAAGVELLSSDRQAVRTIVRRSAPRLVRDAFGPLAVFVAGWKLLGLVPGVALAALFGLAVFVHERRQGQPGLIVRLALLLVAIRVTVGLSSGSATTYLAQEIVIDMLLACAVLASLLSPRPFAARFAADVFPIPASMAGTPAVRQAMRTVTAVWGMYFLARGGVRLVALLTLSTDRYVLVAALSDAPFLVALLAWSVYHTAAALRRDPQWPALVQAAQASMAKAR